MQDCEFVAPLCCMRVLWGRQASWHNPPNPLSRPRQFAWASIMTPAVGSGVRTFDEGARNGGNVDQWQ